MAIDLQRLKLKKALLALDELGEPYKIGFASACQRLDYKFSREQFNSGIDNLPGDKLPVLAAFLNSWKDLIVEAKRQHQAVAGNTPKSAAPSKTPALVANSTGEVRGLTSDEEQALLARHNSWRIMFHAEPLAWDKVLANKAQAWSNHLAATNTFEHNQVRVADGFVDVAGENLYTLKGSSQAFKPDHQNPVDAWGNEEENWDTEYSRPKGKAVTGHFTQLVWKSTKYVGCGYTLIQTGTQFRALWVCNYHPAGNVIGQYAAQVGKKRRG